MSIFEEQKVDFIKKLYSEKTITISKSRVVSFADSNNKASIRISEELIDVLEAKYKIRPIISKKLQGQTAGKKFEFAVKEYIESTFMRLDHIRPGQWELKRLGNRSKIKTDEFVQYEHLHYLNKLAKGTPELLSVLGNDYLVAPDVVLYQHPYEDDDINKKEFLVDKNVARHTAVRRVNNEKAILHASISAKLTMRSDRAQNSRTEALNLIRNRKGRLPHIVVVTAEPTGGRLASLALGTGDVDCVYHFALPELLEATHNVGATDTEDIIKTLVNGNRLKDVTDLPLDLIL